VATKEEQRRVERLKLNGESSIEKFEAQSEFATGHGNNDTAPIESNSESQYVGLVDDDDDDNDGDDILAALDGRQNS
jgi:hypothetical protein